MYHGVEQLTCAGILWHVEADWADVFRSDILSRIGRLDGGAGVERIKRTVRRTIWSVALADGRRVIVKEFRLRGWTDRLKRRVVGSKPEIEWTASTRLRDAGVAASHALGWGAPVDPASSIEGYLIVEVLPDVVGLGALLRKADDPVERIRELARFIRSAHDRGIHHRDLHSGNILARGGASEPEDRFLLIDLHRIRIGRRPSMPERAGAVAHLVRTLDPGGGSVKEAFLEAYCEGPPALASRHLAAAHIARLMARQQAVRLRSRQKRCVKNTSTYAISRVQGARIHHHRGIAAAEVLAAIEEHRRACAPTQIRRASDRGEMVLEVRAFPPGGLVARCLSALLGSPGVQAYAAGHRAWLAKQGGPEPVAAAVLPGGASYAIFRVGGAPLARSGQGTP